MINKKLRAAIIGANSYIARNLIYKIRNNYSKLFKLELYDRHEKHADNVEPYHRIDLLDVQTFSSVNYDCDLLYVFAGKTGTAQGFDDYESYIDINEKGLLNILKVHYSQGSKARIIFPSTRLVYKGQKDTPLTESAEKEFKTLYAINKFSCEQYLNIYHEVFGIPYTVFRICVPYGTLIPEASSYGTADFFLSKAKKGENILLYGDGRQKRTLIHIGDLCEALIQGAVNSNCGNEVYNIGGADHMSLCDMARVIAGAYKVEVEFTNWPDMAKNIESGDSIFDSTKFDRAINFRYSIHFSEWIIEELKELSL